MKWLAARHCLFAFTFSMLHDAEPEASAKHRLPVFYSPGGAARRKPCNAAKASTHDLQAESPRLFKIML
jgi:hypothetical protein